MNFSCTGILDFDRHAVILPLRQHLQTTLLESRLAQTKINKTNLYFLQQKEAQNFFRPSHGVSQVRMQGSPLDYLLGYPLHQASRKLLCLVWNGGRGGRNSNCATALQVLLDIKDPWNTGRAECNTSYVPFWPLFSHTTHSSPLFLSSGRPPVPSPSPVSPGFKKIFESWPFPPPPFLLPSLPYHCSPLQLLSPELPHLVLHPGIFIQLLKPPAPPLPQPLCWLFTLFFSFTVPLQRQGSSVRAGGSLPALGPGVTVASQTRNCRNIPRAQPGPSGQCCAVTCAATGRQELWPTLSAGGASAECCNKLDVQESTIFWRCQIWVYFPGDSKGHTFQVLSSKHGGTAGHKKKTAGKIYSRWIKQCVFS